MVLQPENWGGNVPEAEKQCGFGVAGRNAPGLLLLVMRDDEVCLSDMNDDIFLACHPDAKLRNVL